jgi:NAD(P)-dependent dehydrogenase (short-subunit alcohol dehydrogenase family)
MLEVTLGGTFLKEVGRARIVNCASGAALFPYLLDAQYSAPKGAVFSWTRTIAREWAPHGISANVVGPALRQEAATR